MVEGYFIFLLLVAFSYGGMVGRNTANAKNKATINEAEVLLKLLTPFHTANAKNKATINEAEGLLKLLTPFQVHGMKDLGKLPYDTSTFIKALGKKKYLSKSKNLRRKKVAWIPGDTSMYSKVPEKRNSLLKPNPISREVSGKQQVKSESFCRTYFKTIFSDELKKMKQRYTEKQDTKEDRTEGKEANKEQTAEQIDKYWDSLFSASRGKRYGGWGKGAEASTDFDFWTPRSFLANQGRLEEDSLYEEMSADVEIALQELACSIFQINGLLKGNNMP